MLESLLFATYAKRARAAETVSVVLVVKAVVPVPIVAVIEEVPALRAVAKPLAVIEATVVVPEVQVTPVGEDVVPSGLMRVAEKGTV
jgi:hypothetical protein